MGRVHRSLDGHGQTVSPPGGRGSLTSMGVPCNLSKGVHLKALLPNGPLMHRCGSPQKVWTLRDTRELIAAITRSISTSVSLPSVAPGDRCRFQMLDGYLNCPSCHRKLFNPGDISHLAELADLRAEALQIASWKHPGAALPGAQSFHQCIASRASEAGARGQEVHCCHSQGEVQEDGQQG